MLSDPVDAPFFILDYSNYSFLLTLRDAATKEVKAMQRIVATANMNPEVLLKDVLEKKRRSIARIDASAEGREFLAGLVETEPSADLSKILKRLRIGSNLYKKRSILNQELIDYQTKCVEISSSVVERRVLLVRFIDSKLASLKDILIELLKDESDVSINEAFVKTVLIEELEVLRKQVNRKPKL